MSKLLKYRVWDIDRKELHYPENGVYKPTDEHWNHIAGYYLLNQMGHLFCNDGIMLDDWHESFIITEFIGIKDKFEKEIYDGDIIKWDCQKKPLEVRWCDKMACFLMTKDGMTNPFYFGLINPSELKVVGNIFQNKRLLK